MKNIRRFLLVFARPMQSACGGQGLCLPLPSKRQTGAGRQGFGSLGKVTFTTRMSIIVAAMTLVMAGCTGEIPSVQLRMDPTETYRNGLYVLREALRHEDPVVRSQAIEALAQTEGIRAGGDYLRGLDDESPTVRFAAAMALGDVKYTPALAKLEQMAEDKQGEPDKRTYCAVLYALYRISGSKRAAELRKLLFDPQKEVRACSAQAMGRMGEPTAIEWLKSLDRNEQDMSVRLQVAHSLALLNDVRSAQILEGYARSQFLEDRLVAISAIAETGASGATGVLRSLMTKRRPPRVQVAAAGALARLGSADKNAYKLCVTAAKNPRQVLHKALGTTAVTDVHVASLQQIAAISLGWMGNKAAASVLYPLLHSENGSVRVAAAMSLLRIFEDFRPMTPHPAPPLPQAAPKTQPAKASGPSKQSVQGDKPDNPPPTEAKIAPQPAGRKRPKLHTAGGKN